MDENPENLLATIEILEEELSELRDTCRGFRERAASLEYLQKLWNKTGTRTARIERLVAQLSQAEHRPAVAMMVVLLKDLASQQVEAEAAGGILEGPRVPLSSGAAAIYNSMADTFRYGFGVTIEDLTGAMDASTPLMDDQGAERGVRSAAQEAVEREGVLGETDGSEGSEQRDHEAFWYDSAE